MEIAHVLFMDIVGYSQLPMSEQTQVVRELQDLVRDAPIFRHAEARGDLIRLPSGDGMALVFFHDPVAPVQCAMQIARALRDPPHLKLRMGIHSGPVYRVMDINAHEGVAGGGVNMAQRVMDCGDAGHILLSSASTELLRQVGAWPLHDLGECDVKHGVRLHLFNLCTGEVGNTELPERLRSQLTARELVEVETRITRPAAPLSVALLYRRNAQPDETLLEFLEEEFRKFGYEVFIDRHLPIGVEWAKEIERKLWSADAVVPLLSSSSIQSEMLAYEVQMAHEASQQQQGKPRLLPVRVNYEGPLPEPLPGILDPIEYVLWQGVDDNQRMVESLLKSLETPAAAQTERPVRPARTTIPLEQLEPVGGAVPIGSKFYVFRPTDAEFISAVARRDSIVLVKGARQMGKTSLLARGLHKARDRGGKVVLTDYQKLNAAHLESIESFLLALAESLADQLDLEVFPEEVWNPRRSPNMNFERYLRREALEKSATPVAWGMDEVDRLFATSYASEVFGLFRSWHNERSLDPSGPISRLTLCIAYATEAHLFIRDLNQSPFNVGTRVTLADFTLEQVADLNERYGSPLETDAEVNRYFELLGGHPYLIRRGFHEMISHNLGLAEFEAVADHDEGPLGDHLRRVLVSLVQDSDLCNVLKGVLRGQPCPTLDSFYRLRSAGVISGDSGQNVRPRCRVYESYIQHHLLP
jgi:class 3 adenylate cyclase